MEDMRSRLRALEAMRVTNVIAGGANGSIFVAEWEERYSLTVYCCWRLDLPPRVLTGSNESSDARTGNLPAELKKLTGDEVQSVEVSDLFDLRITFGSGKILTVFCDITPRAEPRDYDENWAFCDPQSDQCWAVNNRFEVVTSKYRSPGA